MNTDPDEPVQQHQSIKSQENLIAKNIEEIIT